MIVIAGSSGLAREAAWVAEEAQLRVLGFLDVDSARIGEPIGDYTILGTDDYWQTAPPDVWCLIGIGRPRIVDRVAHALPEARYARTIIHPRACGRWQSIRFGPANIICAGVVFTTDIHVDSFNYFNLNVTVGHDARIGSYNVINPGVNISGGVNIGDGCLIGTGAQILEGLTIGDGAVIGAGAVVTKDVPPDITVVGVPAKPIASLGIGE